jgi:dipeptidyl aminopeptidase/acylaminoacyl peptidase
LTTRRYTLEMAVDLRVPSHLRLSPDNERVAFCVAPIGHREKDPTSAIHVAPSDGSSLPRPITGAEHNNIAPRWSPDSSAIAFLSDRAKRGEQQLHVVRSTGGEPLRLTNLQGGVDQPDWHPDGRTLAFTARRKALAGEKESTSDIRVASERWKPKAVATVPATGGTPVLVGPAAGHVWAFSYSPTARRSLLSSRRPRTWRSRSRRLASSSSTPMAATSAICCRSPVSPDR